MIHGLNFFMTDIRARFDDFDASCIPVRSESLLLLSPVEKAGRLYLDFHRCEMPFRVGASDY